METIKPLTIGELNSQQRGEIAEHLTQLHLEFTLDIASELRFTAHDPELRMHSSGYFMVQRTLTYGDTIFEIAAVQVRPGAAGVPEVTVEARPRGVQRLRRQKGAANFGAISPTSFAQARASEAGLKFFGEATPAKGAIVRQQNENTDESTWDVLARLAGEAEFVVFEASGVLHFASEKFLINNQTTYAINWPSLDTDPFHLIRVPEARRSEDSPAAATVRMDLARTNAVNLRPGQVIDLKGLTMFEGKYLIDRVEYDEGKPDPVKVSARTIDSTEDMTCEARTFRRGDRGDCVKRIQLAVGSKPDGIFGPVTEAAVKKFQSANGIYPSGIVEAKTWGAITR